MWYLRGMAKVGIELKQEGTGANWEVDLEGLAQEVLTKNKASLIHRIQINLKEHTGIHRHQEVVYVWQILWDMEDGQIDFTLRIWEVRPYMRNGKETKRKPKLIEVVAHQFTEKI